MHFFLDRQSPVAKVQATKAPATNGGGGGGGGGSSKELQAAQQEVQALHGQVIINLFI